jgi:hypothetical protein
MAASLMEHIEWANASPDRVLIVPGTHLSASLATQNLISREKVLDMFSFMNYHYPDLSTKDIAFFDYPSCLRMFLYNTVRNIVEVETDGTVDPV